MTAEMAFALRETIDYKEIQEIIQKSQTLGADYEKYTLARSYFDVKEYDRAAYFIQDCSHPKVYFLYMYSRYLADEKRKTDNRPDSIGPPKKIENGNLKVLQSELSERHKKKELDGFCLYLYGVVLKKLDFVKEAIDVFVEAVRKEPLHWGAWQEMTRLITDREMMSSLVLPDHWMKQFFLAHLYLELQMNDEAVKLYMRLCSHGFHRSTYIMAQNALAFHNRRAVDQAVSAFESLQKYDPYRLDNMDTYSNLLYVKEMRAELAYLAHRCCDIDKYRMETCCVIGNYYSLRSQHEKAVLYFQRALRLNPHYLSAWTLIGHEFMEMKNSSAAIQAYRQAVEVNRRDYRAWYGLGQTYEIMKMPFYSLYYYRQAHQLRPNDSRMVVAMGESYEKLDQLQEAKKCFWKAHSLGDVEGLALIKLARLYEKLKEEEQAAAAYTEFIYEAAHQGNYSREDQSQAYMFLTNYYLKREMLDEALSAAQKCAEFTETREEAKDMLKEIANLRMREGAQIQEVNVSITDDQLPSGDHTPFSSLPPMNLRFTP
ncbi:cell division cycle protein 23 homolog isoform X2 [Liolophura sinensis]|uniref:cell division cycle protein 23 homolog isoform X2 n=1 Tax=Liolophura sinensis TaxID=3198878 RepID=UPI0031595F8F